jgi:hypothetical protein
MNLTDIKVRLEDVCRDAVDMGVTPLEASKWALGAAQKRQDERTQDTARRIFSTPHIPASQNTPAYHMPDWRIVGIYQTVRVGKSGVRYQKDTSHAAKIRREARKRGLAANIQLGNGVAHVRLTRPAS